ncbi:aminoglycoside N(3)-acetyltransferase [Kroppenstedtia eburnea]|uniref:Aminoglycoside N(3)-acetyltransferase n=1 Tax=Kroppenstedtia eburnea TaxID=714067 RepID=A0A1N7KZ85_9BACL|nr:AAC(3) family N-acetyltransferase [Kroppenstedtia eburnea]QKI82738.1 AAC(3) family N-acetyltransferase [Kroppenstedtia eburnea]SIS66884.1 aminoglycoside 3-N-acetyltransferase [Kroppenstedtia eburnea]
MGEQEAIQRTSVPGTRESLAADLKELGLGEGETVIVHTSLSSLGYVVGGGEAVIHALMDVLTPSGTLVMPTQSPQLSDPSHWENPPVPEEWWPVIRNHLPAYDPQVTPAFWMGKVADTFRTFPGVLRSDHPKLSLAAWGKEAGEVVADHGLAFSLGENSPLAKLYDRSAHVLLLGVGYESNTSFHLAEYRVPGGKVIEEGAPVMEKGRRVWKVYQDLDHQTDLFPAIGEAFERTHPVQRGRVGLAESRLFGMREAVDFAVDWFTRKRSPC